MNLDKLNKWVTLAANLGVLAGIIFLVIEIQQNTTATEAAMRESVNTKDMTFLSLTIDPSVLARAWAKVENDQPLSKLEASQLVHREYINFVAFEHSYYQFRKGILEPSEWARHENIARTVMQNRSASREMWSRYSNTFGPEFVVLIEDFLAQLDESDSG